MHQWESLPSLPAIGTDHSPNPSLMLVRNRLLKFLHLTYRWPWIDGEEQSRVFDFIIQCHPGNRRLYNYVHTDSNINETTTFQSVD